MHTVRILLIMAAVIASIYGFATESFPLFAGCLATAYLLFVLEYALRYLGYLKIRKHGERRRAVLVDCTQFEVGYERNLLLGETYELTVRVGDEQFEVQGAFDKPPCEVGDELDVMYLANAEYVVLPDAVHRNEYFSHILIRCFFVLMFCFLIGVFCYLRINRTENPTHSELSETTKKVRELMGWD